MSELNGFSDAILGQEAAGQESFVSSDTLPTDMKGQAKEFQCDA